MGPRFRSSAGLSKTCNYYNAMHCTMGIILFVTLHIGLSVSQPVMYIPKVRSYVFMFFYSIGLNAMCIGY